MDCLSDVHIAGKKLFLVQGDAPQLMNWEQYGLRIGVSKGTLSSSDTAEVSVVALVGGQFVFPDNTKLVSGVYAISVSQPLLQPLRLEVQHCVNLTREAQTKCLKFVIASDSSLGLPYTFSTVDGGEFTVGSRYGFLSRKSFSPVGIVSEMNEPVPNGGSEGEGGGDNEENKEEEEEETMKE